jgi:hypothetical protein
MKKPEKILLIFLLFFIYFITIKIFSLKFREGRSGRTKADAKAPAKAATTAAAAKKSTCPGLYNIDKKCKYYKNNKSLCAQAIKKKCKKKYCNFSFYGAEPRNNSCEYSQCLRPYVRANKGCVGEGGEQGQEDIYNETINPCMNIDFCKNCKKCYDDSKNKDKIPLDDGTLFDCKKCLHNGRKEKPLLSSITNEKEKKKKSMWCSYIGWGC